MEAFLMTVIYKRGPAELAKICRNPELSDHFKIFYGKNRQQYILKDSVTGKREYTWTKGKSMDFKKWYAKNCPKVSHDITIGAALGHITNSRYFHFTLAALWLVLSVSITAYRLASDVSDDDENKLAAGFIAGGILLNIFVFMMLYNFSYGFGRLNYRILLIMILNPVILPLVIIILNLTNAENRNDYKKYLWGANLVPSVFYAFLGVFIGYAFGVP